MDGRDKPGHDDGEGSARVAATTFAPLTVELSNRLIVRLKDPLGEPLVGRSFSRKSCDIFVAFIGGLSTSQPTRIASVTIGKVETGCKLIGTPAVVKVFGLTLLDMTVTTVMWKFLLAAK